MHIHLRKLGLGLLTLVVATTLFLAVAASDLVHPGGTSRARFEAARSSLDGECARWLREGGSHWQCNVSENESPLFPRLRRGRASVASASLALTRSDAVTAERELAAALDVVGELDRLGNEVSIVMSASLLRDTLAVIETKLPGGISGREMKARLLAGRRLRSVAHPLEAQRLIAMRTLLDAFDRPFVRGLGLQLIAGEEERIAAMERAIALGDTQGCMRADERRSWLSSRYAAIAAPNSCSLLVEAAQTGKRLDQARKAALRRPSPGARRG